ncbi:hypothetical protein Mal52_25730 [Symmachiella dynata]|uniref:Uncharacterized protein n=1 Tax=Symmachiella dynata TaxID=2527995 RepID=A0A517ZNN8_9PLAN|nr:hypothetical protein [Symmachiella dynata]QDU44095.1 hypothetical protein Mal52_25730 [Symmachiella dynata]
MRHRFAYSLLLLSLFATTEGCRSAGSPLTANPFGAEEQVAESSSSDSRFMSAFRKSRQGATTAKTEQRDPNVTTTKPSTESLAAGPTSGFDAETEALIERKLASATPEQKARMRRDLQGVPPHLIPQILNAFHLGQQLEQETAYGRNDAQPPTDRLRSIDANQQYSANVPPQGRFAPQQPAVTAGHSPYGAAQPPGQFPGAPQGIVQAGHAQQGQGNQAVNHQADWNGGQTSAPGQSAMRIGDYQPPGQYGGITQAGNVTPQRSTDPADNLPTYYQPGQPQPGQTPVGSLKPGEFDNARNSPNGEYAAQPGQIQQTNVTMANTAPLALQSPEDQSRAVMTWRTHLGQSIGTAEREVAQLRPGMNNDSPASRDFIENNVYLRMLYLMSDQPAQQARAWEPIPGIDPAQQEFWQYTLYGMSNYFDRNPQLVGPERYSEAVKSFTRATNKLSSLANLEIGDIALCSSVTNFGNYKRIEPEEFSPGQQVVLYAEIRNFSTRLTDENLYLTTLAPTIEFLIPGNGPMSGRAVQNAIEMQPTEDLCKYPRRDFFIASLFSIPRDLAQGRYVLKLTVTDKLGQKFAESTLNFKVK